MTADLYGKTREQRKARPGLREFLVLWEKMQNRRMLWKGERQEPRGRPFPVENEYMCNRGTVIGVRMTF